MSDFLVDPVVTMKLPYGDEGSNVRSATIVPGTSMMAVKLALPAGFVHPWHNHPEHESMGTVISGRLRMVVGEGEPFELLPGDTWHHPIGVYHSNEALEDSEAVEIHSPLRPDLLAHLYAAHPHLAPEGWDAEAAAAATAGGQH